MGAYDNPQILRDTSLNVYSKAIENLGKSVAAGLLAQQKARKARAASAEKNRLRVQGAQSKIANLQWKNATTNQGNYKGKKEGDLWEAYLRNVTYLLEGNGTYKGSIAAATENETNPNITKEQRSVNQAIINQANIYQTNAIQNNSYAIGDLIDFDAVREAGMLKTHYWAGDSELQQDINMMTAFGLKNLAIKGSSYVRDQLIGDGKSIEEGGNGFPSGASILSVETTIEKDSEAWNELSDKTKEHLEKNNFKLSFKKDFASLINVEGENITGGLIREIGETINTEAINKTSGIVADGEIDGQYVMGGEGSTANIVTRVEGKSRTIGYEIVDQSMIRANETLNGQIDGAIANMLNNPTKDPNTIGDLKAQMQNTLKMGTDPWNIVVSKGDEEFIVNNFKDFSGLTLPEKEKILREELYEKYTEDTFSKIDSSRFKDLRFDLKQFVIKNNNGIEPDPDEFIYLKEKFSQVSKAEDQNIYMQSIAANILELDITQNRDIPGAIEPKQEWSATNVAIHENYLRNELGLDAASGQSAKDKVKKQLQKEADAAIASGESTKTKKEIKAEIDAEVGAMELRSLWIRNPKNGRWDEQQGYDSFSNKSLRNILSTYVFGRTAADQKEFQNYYTNQDRAKALANAKTN